MLQASVGWHGKVRPGHNPCSGTGKVPHSATQPDSSLSNPREQSQTFSNSRAPTCSEPESPQCAEKSGPRSGQQGAGRSHPAPAGQTGAFQNPEGMFHLRPTLSPKASPSFLPNTHPWAAQCSPTPMVGSARGNLHFADWPYPSWLHRIDNEGLRVSLHSPPVLSLCPLRAS